MIIVNARFLTQQASGVQRFAFEIAKRLKSLDAKILFVAPSNIEQKAWAEVLKPTLIAGRTGHLWEQTSLRKFLKTQKDPLLINLANTAPLYLKNQIVVLHDVAFWAYPSAFKKSFTLWYQFLSKNISRYAKRIITVSQFSKQEIEHYLPQAKGKISVVLNGFTALKAPETANHEPNLAPYFLAVGNLDPRKNLPALIEAFQQAKLDSAIKLKIAGSRATVFKAAKIELSPRIELLGYQSDAELARLYTNALSLVFPSIYEGFGLPILEAMNLGCPTILANIPVFHEVAGEAALFTDSKDPKALAKSLETLANDARLRQNLCQKGLKQVQNYSWEAAGQAIFNIIKQEEEKIL